MIKSTLSTIATVATLVIATQASAAVITFEGTQTNVDPKVPNPTDNTPPTKPNGTGITDTVGWRNPTTPKTYDVDGNNVIGTDGYLGRGGTSLPSYITSFNSIAAGNTFGYMDDPANITHNDYAVGFWGSSSSSATMFSFTITGTDLTGKTLGVAIQNDAYGSGSQTYTMSQIAGSGSGSASTTVTAKGDGYDWTYFYITGAVAGDQFQLDSAKTATGSINNLGYSAVAFDSAAVPEPASLALALVGCGLLVFRRRNRVA